VRIGKGLATAEDLGRLGKRFRCDSQLTIAYLLVTVKWNFTN
jgi:hypothetical protein